MYDFAKLQFEILEEEKEIDELDFSNHFLFCDEKDFTDLYFLNNHVEKMYVSTHALGHIHTKEIFIPPPELS
jgi:hypothetical protein